ncbi:C-C motif chemokine 5-like isoform X2 [Toxotes jaculatrix]|uniref:C-C motif chemokine 5-like isoform X2 n=1 Tax=Toxotes jaculatrix TaxID=941984 RepID=UPI001B3AF81D|nr:C-C motif chemokine 5-like isoform X2 [Toxotes jaculatrix]
MMPKPLLLLAALTLCCCITTLHASSRRGCICLRTTTVPIRRSNIETVVVNAVSGQCRHIEIIVTTRNGRKVCVDPAAKWFKDFFSTLEKVGCVSGRARSCVHRQLLR